MTNSVVKRGRKPKGEFAGKLANFSTRIQPETRKALEKEAKATGQSISQLAERLLITGLAERKASEKDRALHALCFLIGELAHRIVGTLPHDWRSDPFFYEAFKIAVRQVLDALDPPGAKEHGEYTVRIRGSLSATQTAAIQHYADSFETPEARAEYVSDQVDRKSTRLNSSH